MTRSSNFIIPAALSTLMVGSSVNYVELIFTGLSLMAQHIEWVIIGTVVGMFFALIPGLGGTVTLALMIPFTFPLEPFPAIGVLAGALGSGSFAGSVTAIMINTPGRGSNAATLLDGYPMTLDGRSAEAIGASAFASASGAIVGNIVFILGIPVMVSVALLFGPPELFWLVLIALFIIPIIVSNNIFLGLATAAFGGLLSMIGTASHTGEDRFIFGISILREGIGLIPFVVGLFAIAEVIRLFAVEQNTIVDSADLEGANSKWKGVREVIKHKYLWLRCAVIGTVIGAVPGAGGTTAAFVAYGHAIQSSGEPDKFGKGTIEGVIAPESANDSKDGGQLFPTLGLGIPGGGATAVLLAGMLIHGFAVGPDIILFNRDLVIYTAYSLILANILSSTIGMVITSQLIRVLQIPLDRLVPAILVLALPSVLVLRSQGVDLVLALVFGLLGFIMLYANINRVPILIAFILTPIMERNFFAGYQYASGDWVEAFFTGTLNRLLVVMLILTVLYAVKKNVVDPIRL